jgi:hypothetical protein
MELRGKELTYDEKVQLIRDYTNAEKYKHVRQACDEILEQNESLTYGFNGQLNQVKKAFSWIYKYAEGETFDQAIQKVMADIRSHENDQQEQNVGLSH